MYVRTGNKIMPSSIMKPLEASTVRKPYVDVRLSPTYEAELIYGEMWAPCDERCVMKPPKASTVCKPY